MRVYKSLKPGRNGTKELVEQFGESLVCVRYRIDTTTSKVYKTVELVVEERRYQPTQTSPIVHQALAAQETLHTPDIETTKTAPYPAEPVHAQAVSSPFFWFRFRGYLPVLFNTVVRAGARKGESPGVWGLPTNIAEKLGLLESDLVREVQQKESTS